MCDLPRSYGPDCSKYLLSWPLQRVFAEPDTEEQWDLKVKFSAIYVETDFGK